MNNDLLGTLTSSIDEKLDNMFQLLNQEGKGAIVFINKDTNSLNLLNRLSALKDLQKTGELRAPRVPMDNKDFGIGAQILHDLGISKIRLMFNSSQTKRVGIIGYGLEIVEYVNY